MKLLANKAQDVTRTAFFSSVQQYATAVHSSKYATTQQRNSYSNVKLKFFVHSSGVLGAGAWRETPPRRDTGCIRVVQPSLDVSQLNHVLFINH